jgi:hypothetical protein
MYGTVGAAVSFWGAISSVLEKLGPAWVFNEGLDIMLVPAGIAPRLLALALDILLGLKANIDD